MERSDGMSPQVSPDERLDRLEAKIDAIYGSVEKTRKYFLTSLIVTVVLFVLPLIGLLFALPTFIDTISSTTGAYMLNDI